MDEEKIKHSYDVLKLGAEMSRRFYQKPLVCTYSGGKDSTALVQLAIECLKPEEFEVFCSWTTVDAPQTCRFIKSEFKRFDAMGIKTTIHYPHDKVGRPISMWTLIPQKGMPPTRIVRYCCSVLKEASTPNRFIATGVRAEESNSRKNRSEFEYIEREREEGQRQKRLFL